MEGRRPPQGDEGFEWEDSPARPSRRPSEPSAPPADQGTGERPARPAHRETGSFAAIREGIAERRRAKGETGEFERGGRKPPPGRRDRHRDLPARVRRRQAYLIGGGAVVLLVALIVLISSGGGSSQQPVPLKKLVGQEIVGKLSGSGPDQDLLKAARKGQIGGVITFQSDPQKLKADVAQLQSAAKAGGNPPLLVMVDQEGGSVKRLKAGPPTISPADLGKSGDEGQAKDQGRSTGQYLRGLGVNVDLAPVLDVAHPQTDPTLKSRTFGSDPSTIAKVGVAFAQGLNDGGAVATAKHFPGLGWATVSTDNHPVTIAATSDQLQSDLLPFKAAVAAGVPMVMVSTASYPTLGAKKPAALSPQIVKTLLRGQLGFNGVVITDDLESPALGNLPPVVAARSALAAGDDLLLYAKSTKASTSVFGDLVKAVKSGQLDRSVVQSAYNRITDLKSSPTG